MKTNQQLFDIHHEETVTCVRIVYNFDVIVTSSRDKTTRFWSLKDGKQLRKLSHPDKCYNFDLSTDNSSLAVVHGDSLTIWKLRKGETFKLKEIHFASKVCDVRFNGTASLLVVGLRDGTLYKIRL